MMFVTTFNPAELAFLFGSVVGVLIILSIAKKVLSKFLKGGIVLYASYLVSMTFVTVLAAYGMVDGYSPQWRAAFFSYLPAHLIWFLYDLLKPKLFEDSKSPNVFSKEAMKRFAVFLLIAGPGCLMAMFLIYGTGLAETDSTKAYTAKEPALQTNDLIITVEEFNKNLPLKVDNETTILSLSLEGHKTLIYQYQISNTFYSTPGVKEEMGANGLARMVEYFCFDGAPELKKKGITAINRYMDESGNYLTQSVLDTNKCTEEYLGLIAKGIQGQLPIQQDKVTMLVNAETVGDRGLIYTYTLSSEFYNSPGVKENMAVKLPQNIRQHLCLGEDQNFKKMNAKIYYRYLDEGGNLLTEFALDTAECSG